MSVDLELTVLREASEDAGFVGGFAITDQLLVAAGGTSRAPAVLASSNARHFERRSTPRTLGLRAVVAAGDVLWTCGEYGQLARSRDLGASWELVETGTEGCLFGLALAGDGALWVVGEAGYSARVRGDELERIDLGTSARLSAIHALGDELVVLGGDGAIRRWRDGRITVSATGSEYALTALAVTRVGTWVVVGDGGFIARSPDGAWFARAKSGVEVDLEGVIALADGRLAVVGDHGLVLVSADDARTWTHVPSALTAHLWSVARFGGGAVIGGDDGLILKLAPRGDQTWHDRLDMFGTARALDEVFAAGPEGFVGKRLPAYLDAIDNLEPEPEPEPEPLDALTGEEAFERNYGVPLPPDVVRLRALAAGRVRAFEELALDARLLPDVGERNLFELLVLRDQEEAELGTGLVEAFSGVCGLGSQGNGDTYHLELYEWDGPRQVLHFDHETRTFTGVFADCVDSLVYLAALARAHDADAISRDAFELGLRKLHGRVAPTWHFAIEDHDPDFVALDPKRRDTEFFFYRSRWICALLGDADALEVVPRLFDPNFNQVVPAEQLPARFEACERLIPTALYAMWRAFLFDEPELEHYVELGRAHRARLVRDAARLIDELRAGRNELGAIRDMRAHLAAFRALDLDPRRAGARAREAEARARADTARKHEAAAELARTPRAGWLELAWRWVGDGAAHRALLDRLAREPEVAAQLARLAELRACPAAERELALWGLASMLAPELEALLAGSILRADRLPAVRAAAPEEDEGGDDDEDGDGDDDDDGDNDDDHDDDDWDDDDEAEGNLDEDRGRHITSAAGDVLHARARAGRLDPRALDALLPVLDQPARYEHRRRAVADVVGALRHAPAVPALIRILETTRIDSPLDAIGKQELVASTAAALGALAEPAAGAALAAVVAAPGRHNDRPRAAAAEALATCLATAAEPHELDAAIGELLATIRERDDGELVPACLLACGRLAALLPPELREDARGRLAATRAACDDAPVLLAHHAALVLSEPGASPPAELRQLLHEALTSLAYDHEATVRDLRIALRTAEVVPELAAAEDLVWLTRFAEADVRACAHALLERLGRPLPPARLFDAPIARALPDGELVALIAEPHVVGRAALIAEAGRRRLAAAHRAIVDACHDVISRARPGGANLLEPDARVVEAAVDVLAAPPVSAEAHALFERILRQPSVVLKWQVKERLAQLRTPAYALFDDDDEAIN